MSAADKPVLLRSGREAHRANVGYSLLAQIVSSVVGAGVYVVVGRQLGSAELGLWTAALALTVNVSSLFNLGIHVPVGREVARDARAAERYLGFSSALNLSLSWPLIIGVSLGVAWLLRYDGSALQAMALAAVATAALGFAQIWHAALQALNRFDLFFAIQLGSGVLKLGGLIAALHIWPSLTVAFLVICVAHLAPAILGVWFMRRALPGLRLRFDRALLRPLAVEGLPVALAGTATQLGLRADSIILERLATAAVAGGYSAAYSFFMLGAVALYAITQGLFPAFARLSAPGATGGAPGQFDRMVRRALGGIVLLGLAAAAVGWVLAPTAVTLVYGRAYAESAAWLRVLLFALPFVGVSRMCYQALNADGRQVQTFIGFTAGVVFNLTANLLLIPRYGALAAAVTTVATEAIIGAVLLYFVRRAWR